jgi:hypothetical protein
MRDETIRVIFGVLMVYVILVPAFTVTLYCIDEQNRQGVNYHRLKPVACDSNVTATI